jgi:F0F1-type ATP synthase gamma subunit
MSKSASIKSDLDDVSSMVEVFQILKDVASNHFYNTAKRKERFLEFAEAFADFFRMTTLTNAKTPLVFTSSDVVGLVAITSEGGFMAEMTAKVIKQAMREASKHEKYRYYVVGQKGCDKMRNLGIKDFTPFVGVEEKGLYRTSLEVKDFLIKEVEEGKVGKVFAVYPRAISLSFIKPYTLKLLPSEELISQQNELKETIEKVIVESNLDSIIHYLATIWLTCRLYEMLEDCVIAGFAAQSQQLEASLEKLKKDKAALFSSFKKAKKGDIDKSLREVFTAKTITGGKK